MLLAGLTLLALGLLACLGVAAYNDHRRWLADGPIRHRGADTEFIRFLQRCNQDRNWATYQEPINPPPHWATRRGVLEASHTGWPA